jgi:hypothetical protein
LSDPLIQIADLLTVAVGSASNDPFLCPNQKCNSMKKMCSLIVLVIITYIGHSQSTAQFGIRAGGNFSAWVGKDAVGSSLRSGIFAGGIAVLPVSKSFAIQSELLYSQEGTEFGEAVFSFDYIRLPVLLQYRHASGFHLETGLQLGLLVSAKAKSSKDEPAEDVKDQTKILEPGLVTGLGYRHSSGIGLDLRYSVGLSKIGETTSFKSNVIGIGLSYLFSSRK